ncbi:MAG: Mur ligase domain-containing protein, partial [Bacillota bacterium]|nr:Mur ligase domain-containing protein [Bacillota bacterium]
MTPAIRQMNADEGSTKTTSGEPVPKHSPPDIPTAPPGRPNHLSLDQVSSVHLIGIGGIGMSALAHILLSRGIQVTGSDRSESAITRRLAAEGARIDTGHASAHVTDPDWVVYSAAIPAANPERIAALQQGIPQMDRAALLGCIMKDYRHSVSVAGSHGKTTTTALLAMLLEWGGLDPTILVGGELDAIGGNVKVGQSPVLVTEACEYQGSFLRFPARIGVVLNVDLDHLDYFKDLAAVQAVFLQFVRQLPPDGLLVMSATDANSALLQKAAPCPVVMIGVQDSMEPAVSVRNGTSPIDMVTASTLLPGPGGCWSFRLTRKNADLGRYQLGIPGRHNVHNALAALAVAMELGLDGEILRQLLPRFTGIHRRFEYHGLWNGVS